jgi:RNA polymerase sigma-70 factor (ECF subfamily)
MLLMESAELAAPGAMAMAMADDPDAADLDAVLAGDRGAAERLYRRHRGRVLAIGRLMAGARDAEDICHEAFLRALGGLAGFRREVPFAAWLCRIAVNQCRNLAARDRTRRLAIVDGVDAEGVPAAARAQLELRAALARAVGELSQGQREVLVCHDVLGMSHEEIGGVLGCAEGTSKAQLHKARLRLRELLADGERS